MGAESIQAQTALSSAESTWAEVACRVSHWIVERHKTRDEQILEHWLLDSTWNSKSGR